MDRALVDSAQRGDVESFDALARLVGDRCMGVAFRILRDTDRADDAVQASLIAAWRDLRALRDPDRFEPWLHRILIRECYAEARRRRRWSADLHILPTEVPVDAGGYQAVNDRDELDRAFRRLTVEQRAVVVLFHYLDLPMAEVAERVGVPIGTVKSRLYHATRAMRASMEADGRAPIPRERPA
jgi:RNA polymerase sigma-70 factor (ECF subfamily)